MVVMCDNSDFIEYGRKSRASCKSNAALHMK